MSRIKPEAAWERSNWGLSADAALNHHPLLQLPRLNSNATLETTWLRLERQFLTRLPRSNAILFGIRVSNHRVDELVASFPLLAARLERALQTMPEPMAAYKSLAAARHSLIRQLHEIVL